MGAAFLETLHVEAMTLVASVRRTRSASSLMDGSAGIATYANYLREAYHYLHATQSTLALAAERMVERGRHLPLALLLQEKAGEVTGLDFLALDDLEALGFSRADVITSIPAPATRAYIAWINFLGHGDHPSGYLGNAYVLEYLASVCAGPVADGLVRSARIPGIRKAVRLLRNRADTKEGYVRTLANALPPMDDPEEIDVILTSARVARLLYAGILTAIDGMSAMPARRSPA